jgi:hypothetical protein
MLLQAIQVHMRRRRISPTRFGREALGDPNFVLDLQEGRVCRRATEQKVLSYVAAEEAKLAVEQPR